MRLTLKRTAVLIAACLLALGALLAFGLFPQEPLRRLVERRLQDALGSGARIGRLDVVPFRLRAEASDVVMTGPSYLLEVPFARVTLGREALLGPSLAVASLEVERPRLRLRPPPQTTAAPAPRAKPLLLHHVSITDGIVIYDDPALGGPMLFEGVEAHGSVGTATLRIEARGGALQRRRPLTLGPLRAHLRLSPLLDVVVESFEGGTLASRAHIAGTLGRIGDLAPDLKLDGHLALADLSTLDGAPSAEGIVAIEGSLTASAGSLRAEANIESDRLLVAQWPFETLKVRLTHTSERGTTVLLATRVEGARVAVNAHTQGARTLGRLTLESLDLARVRHHRGFEALPAKGTLSAGLAIKGDLRERLELQGKVEALAQPLASLRARLVGETSGEIRLADSALDLTWTLTADAKGGSEGESTHFAGARLTASGMARGPFPGVVDGRWKGTLSLPSPRGREEVMLEGGLRAAGEAVTATLDARALGGGLRASADLRGSLVRRFELSGDGLDLSLLAPELTGRVQTHLALSGPARHLSGSGHVAVAGLAWRALQVGALRADLVADKGAGTLRLDVPSLRLAGECRIRPDPWADIQGRLKLDATPLGPLASMLERPLEGHVSGTLDVRWPFRRPDNKEIQAHIATAEARRDDFAAKLARPALLTLRGDRLAVEDLSIEGSGIALTASGTLGLDERIPLDLRVSIETALDRTPLPAGWTAAGRLSFDGTLSGHRRLPRATGRVSIDNVAVEAPSVPRVTIPRGLVELTGDALSVSKLTAFVGDGSVDLSGQVPFEALLAGKTSAPPRAVREASLDVSWQGVQVASLLERLEPDRPSPLRAALAGRAHVEGRLTSVQELEGEITLEAAPGKVQDVDLRLEPATIRFDRGLLTTDGLSLSAEGGTLRASGSVDLRRRTLDATGKGLLALRALSPFMQDVAVAGTAEVDVSVSGPFDAPSSRGSLTIANGTLRIRDIPQALTQISGSVLFEGSTVRMPQASAMFGGGAISASGSARLAGAALSDVRVTIQARDMAVRYPEGLRSRLDADLALSGRTDNLLLSGQVKVLRGYYSLDIAVEESLLAPVLKPAPSPALRAIGLELRIETENPIVVRNNQANVKTTGSLVLRGNMEEPTLFGTLDVQSGGELTVQGTAFEIVDTESSELQYKGSWDPEVSLTAVSRWIDVKHTRCSGDSKPTSADERSKEFKLQVELAVRGTLAKPTLVLKVKEATEDTPREHSSGEVLHMLVTRTQPCEGSVSRRASTALVGEQVAGLIAGRVTREVSEQIRALGFDQVTIQPNLLVRDTKPGAQLTFRKDLTRLLTLIYSLGLGGPEDSFLQVEAEPFRNVSLTVQRQDDGRLNYSAGQRLRFGGPPRRAAPPARDERVRIHSVRLEGDRPLSEKQILETLDVGTGQRRASWDLQEAADRLRDRLRREGYIEAEAGAGFDGADAVFVIHAGARYRWRVDGMPNPPDLSEIMTQALYEEEALDRGRDHVLRALRDRGYARSSVDTRTEESAGLRTLVYVAGPGPRFSATDVSFPGADAFSFSRLLDAAGGAGEILASPKQAADRIRKLYREHHYLAVEVAQPRMMEDGERLYIEVPIREGRRARIAAVRFEGATLSPVGLGDIAGITAGSHYDERAFTEGAQRIRDHYHSLGYPAIRVTPELRVAGEDLDVVFKVVEDERVFVGRVEITGTSRTKEVLLGRQVTVKAGDVLDLRKLADTEDRIRRLGLFSRVAVSATPDNPCTVRVEVTEEAPLRASYYVRYSENETPTGKEGLTGLVDAEAINPLGLGFVLGGRVQANADRRQIRGSLQVPALTRLGSTTLSVLRLEDDLPAALETEVNERVQQEYRVEQDVPLPDHWSLRGAYRFKRTTLTGFEPVRIAGVDLSLLRETRDNPLDARRGRFLNFTFQLAAPRLGSDAKFVKGYAQAFVHRSLGASLTWAQAYRLGLATGLGGDTVRPTEKFKAGGANSFRGADTEGLGPLDPAGDPEGGNVVLVLNQELRYRHRTGLGAAAFWDFGDVFATVTDLRNDFRLRHTLGAGLRWDSRLGLVRFDVGFPLSRPEGEKRYRLFFGVGQAF